MNYLAHMFLSGLDANIMIGNFLGDSVKGKNILKYNKKIQEGIILHRKIDSFTDLHPVVRKSSHRLMPKYHKYAPVIVDMYYDHFLSKYWNDYASISLKLFLKQNFKTLSKQTFLMPKKAGIILPLMIQNQWLRSYADMDKLKIFFKGLSKRTHFISHIENAVEDLEENYDMFYNEFCAFFPEIIDYVQKQGIEIEFLKIQNE